MGQIDNSKRGVVNILEVKNELSIQFVDNSGFKRKGWIECASAFY